MFVPCSEGDLGVLLELGPVTPLGPGDWSGNMVWNVTGTPDNSIFVLISAIDYVTKQLMQYQYMMHDAVE